MKFFKDYSGIDRDKEEPDYAFINIGDTCDVIRLTSGDQNDTIGYFKRREGDEYNIYVERVLHGGYDNKFIDAQHEAAKDMNFETGNYTKYAQFVPHTAFLNNDGFVDNLGNLHEASRNNQGNISLYQVAKLTKEGKELLKKYKNLSTSTYYACELDKEEAKKHGLEDMLVTIEHIEPRTVSFLYGDLEPKVKIAPNEEYVTNSDKKNVVVNFFGEKKDFLNIDLADKMQEKNKNEEEIKKTLDNKNYPILSDTSLYNKNMSEKDNKNTDYSKMSVPDLISEQHRIATKSELTEEDKKELELIKAELIKKMREETEKSLKEADKLGKNNKNEEKEKEEKNKNEEKDKEEKKEENNKNEDNGDFSKIIDILLRIEKKLSSNKNEDKEEKKEENNKNEEKEKEEKNKNEEKDKEEKKEEKCTKMSSNKNSSSDDRTFNINFDDLI